VAEHEPRVLLVDDEPAVLGMLDRWLTAHGFVICALATDGRQALSAAQQHRPDAIVLDHRLPDIPGGQLLPRLQQLCPGARIVLFTADPAAARAARAAGATALVKGGPLADLHRALTAAPNPQPTLTVAPTWQPRLDSNRRYRPERPVSTVVSTVLRVLWVHSPDQGRP
jgi:CheY-like chemotaxis protein